MYWTKSPTLVQSWVPLYSFEASLADDLYRIGTVAKLTGVSVECLRAWERRHGIAPAERSGRTRFYSHAQLQRLQKIKALIDAGHPISSLADLSSAQLDARSAPTQTPRAAHRLPQVGMIGPNLSLLEQDSTDVDAVEVAQRWVSIDDFTDSRERERAMLDVIVVQLPTLDLDVFSRLQGVAPGARWVIVYQFAARADLSHCQAHGITTHAWPVSWGDLMRACAVPSGSPLRAGRTAPRRFTDHELVAIATQARGQQRQAPGQLVGLITQLNAFGDFATQRSVAGDAEAATYERLREDVSYARAQLERALGAVTELTSMAVAK